MAVGVASGLWFLFIQAKKQGLDAPKLLDMAFYTIIVSLIGAKLVLLAGQFDYSFGLVFALWYMRKNKLSTWKVADIAVPALALGHGFGRIGCFMAGCCFGRECTVPWGIVFRNEYASNLTGIPLDTHLHPTQLYEALLNFTNFLILFVILRKKRFDGQVFSFYIINYSIIRYFVEFYRGDHLDKAYIIQNPSPYLSLSLPQLFCIIGLVGGGLVYFILKRRKSA
jgi:phosphatidylglycerol:prolipoprotein diacylglycerol transferase